MCRAYTSPKTRMGPHRHRSCGTTALLHRPAPAAAPRTGRCQAGATGDRTLCAASAPRSHPSHYPQGCQAALHPPKAGSASSIVGQPLCAPAWGLCSSMCPVLGRIWGSLLWGCGCRGMRLGGFALHGLAASSRTGPRGSNQTLGMQRAGARAPGGRRLHLHAGRKRGRALMPQRGPPTAKMCLPQQLNTVSGGKGWAGAWQACSRATCRAAAALMLSARHAEWHKHTADAWTDHCPAVARVYKPSCSSSSSSM